jgi:hypothetical protein
MSIYTIQQSWWEFCPTYPAIRNAKLGNNAWDDEHGGTLRPVSYVWML